MSDQHRDEGQELPAVDQNKPLPRNSFILPQQYIQSLMSSHLNEFELRLIQEINRLNVWVLNLQTQLSAAHDELDRLNQGDADPKKQRQPPQLLVPKRNTGLDL